MITPIALALLLTIASAPIFAKAVTPSLGEQLFSELHISATLKRATVPACPKEQASELSVSLIDGQVRGHLTDLSLDLTCSQSRLSNKAEPANNDALSLLRTLPAIDFVIDNLTLHLPEGRFTGPAELQHQDQNFTLLWTSGAGPTQVVISAEHAGWRWQGELPGHLLTPSLRQPLRLNGSWQPEKPLTLNVNSALPTPFMGNWQLELELELAAEPAAQGWQLLPSSKLTVPNLRWKELTLSQLSLTPVGDLALDKPWQAKISWQAGRWKQGALPAASLQLEGDSLAKLQGKVRADLAPDLQLTGRWRYEHGLALTMAPQSVPASGVWSWLNGWLLLPVGLDTEAGQLRVSLSAADLLNNRLPILMEAELTEGQVKYRDMLAEELAARVALSWSSAQGWQSRGPQAVSAARLDVGVPISDIRAALRWQNDGIWLSGLTAHLLGGELALSPMALSTPLSGEAHFSDIALEKVLSYAAVDGLTGSGRLKGRLPFIYDQGLSVKNGRADSQSGWISYLASDQLAATGAENIALGLTLGLLSDLRYDNLTADISMAKTGEAVINSHLQGQAPVKGKLHAVNFNYHHQENLLQLLASLRFAQDLTDRLPANLQGESE